MAAQHQTTTQLIAQKITQRSEELRTEFPDAHDWIEQYHTLHTHIGVSQPTVAAQVIDRLAEQSLVDPYVAQVSNEEYATIMEKLVSCLSAATPPTTEEFLYLEQQLSDLLGISISTTVQDHQLPHRTGTLLAAAHYKRYPEDTLANHATVPEAGIAAHRSAFGWFAPQAPPRELEIMREKFWVGLALATLPGWAGDFRQKNWWQHRKVLVINPLAHAFVVATVADVFVSSAQYQLAGSPELVRATRCWAPGAKGQVLLFLIDDPEDSLALGPLISPG